MTSGPFIKKQHLGGWDPWQLTESVLAAWWAADDLVDGSVATWTDRIAGLSVTQGTGGSRPLKASNSFNGAYPGVSFDGNDDNLAMTTLAALPTGSSAGSVWIIGDSAAGGTILSACVYGGTSGGQFRRIAIGTTGVAQVSDGTVSSNSSNLITIPAVIKGDWSGTTMNGYVNGTPNSGNPTTISTLNTGTVRFRLGANNPTSPSQFWSGPIRHVLILKAVLSTILRQKIEGYFAWDSSLQTLLPDSHPYKRFHP